jgi:hypothetical protein
VNKQEEIALEARILRRVASILRGNYSPGYRGYGGPQDGDDIPASFDAPDAARDLERAADELELGLDEEDDEK